MPIISYTSKKDVERHYETISKLKEKCKACELLRGKIPVSMYIYEVCKDHVTNDGPAMLAIAPYGDSTYAIYAPEYLTDEQFVVFEFLLRDAEPNDVLIVFSKESYDAVQKYSYGKPLNVQLCV